MTNRVMLAAIAAVTLARGAHAQAASAVTPAGLVDSAIAAYEDVRFDSASVLLRRALDARGADSLNHARKSTALIYLGVTEFLRDRRDSSSAAFRRLLAHDRHQAPDSVTFPKRVTDYFLSVRKSLHGLAEMHPTSRGVDIIVLAINPHRVSIDVRAPDDRKLFGLYDGMVSDSVAVPWDGRQPNGTYVRLARYEIVVTAQGPSGAVLNVIRLPLVIGQPVPADEIPLPVTAARMIPQPAPIHFRRTNVSSTRLEINGTVTHLHVDNNLSGADQLFDVWLGGAQAEFHMGRATLSAHYAQGAIVLGPGNNTPPPDNNGLLGIISSPQQAESPPPRGPVTESGFDAALRITPWLGVGAGPRIRTYAGADPVRWLCWDAFAQSNVVLMPRMLVAYAELRRTLRGDVDRGSAAAPFGTSGRAEVGIDFSPSGEPDGQWRARLGYGVERSTVDGSSARDVTKRLQFSLGMTLP